MSASVRISLKAAYWLRAEYNRLPASSNYVLQELERAIAWATRAQAARKLAKKPKAAKKRAKGLETKAIRAAVMERADGCCEFCGVYNPVCPLQMDHFWGRAKARQSVENCWALCATCHRQKTDNVPDALRWLGRFQSHARKHGYLSEARHAREKLDAKLILQARAEGGTP